MARRILPRLWSGETEPDEELSDLERWQRLGSKGEAGSQPAPPPPTTPADERKAAREQRRRARAEAQARLPRRPRRPPREPEPESEYLAAYYAARGHGMSHTEAVRAIERRDPVLWASAGPLQGLHALRIEDEQRRGTRGLW